ncbi:hypothetical protein P3X46_014033 [Hevea brasiliensis]|uniref:PP2A regulatory subunit TAP46 n=1 Tax=Hevea brasiliensis TaxID=3981 RepID=A0ABQ9M750_HEVBR|nr:hypothetical protein P3X46_014033 [Hevea brasiliensis]
MEMEDTSLPSLLEQARTIHLTAMGSTADQEMVNKGRKALEKCEEMINKLALFSTNENKDDISTTNLKYILEFFSFCETMELVPEEELRTSSQAGSNSFAERRAQKIALFNSQRAAQAKLLEIKEQKEDTWLTTIALAICKEEQMLLEGDEEFSQSSLDKQTKKAEAWHHDVATRAQYTKPALPITCATFAQDVLEGRVNVSQAHDHKHQPMIFGPASLVRGSLTSERNRIAAQIFQPSHSYISMTDLLILPTMSIEEAGLREMEIMNSWQEKQYEDEDEDDDAVVQKARAWDDWKDDSPRVAGNKLCSTETETRTRGNAETDTGKRHFKKYRKRKRGGNA